MLLQGQGLTIERPRRSLGTLVGAVPAAVALALAAALAVRASAWPVSLTQFLAFLSAGVLVAVALLFAFWSYACSTLRYVLDRSGLTIVWGPIRHFVPLERVQALVHGRGENQPRVRGLSWPGLHVGRGEAEGLGPVLFYSTHTSPEGIIYVRTPEATYALSPKDPARFVAQVQRLQAGAAPLGEAERVQRGLVAAHPLWSDRLAQGLAAGAIALNLALWGYIFSVYPDLPTRIALEFPPLGEVAALQPKGELFRIPATALAVLAVNLLMGLVLQGRERAGTYLLFTGSIFLQLMFWVGAGVAVARA